MRFTDKIQQVLSLAVCLLIISSLAIVKHGEWLGHDFKPKAEHIDAGDTLRWLNGGTCVINTTGLASDIEGYAGKVPLEITVKDNVVVGVKACDNAETEDFFNEAKVLLDKWKGKTIEQASRLKVDAVSGATYSSNAIIGNMQRGLQYAGKKLSDGKSAHRNVGLADMFSGFEMSLKNLAGLLVVLMAAILPLFVKDRRYRLCQMMLNIVVLGFWCGSFLSYTTLMGFMAHGIRPVAMAILLVMLVTAFVYPLFGRKSYYCTNVCPFGALQQAAGKCVRYKVKIKPGTLKRLDMLRQILWALLMLCIWGGVWSDWTDYEPFAAFIFKSASWVTMVIAVAFVLLSFVVTRPYCRFVCPLGTLLKISQTSK